jgi:hypothetical protein
MSASVSLAANQQARLRTRRVWDLPRCSQRHHCFSPLGKPLLADPVPPGALSGTVVVVGSAGQSCADACAAGGHGPCSGRHMPWLDSCDALRERLGCEAGCEASGSPGSGGQADGAPGPVAGPVYIEASAPKSSRPAMCFAAVVRGSYGSQGAGGGDGGGAGADVLGLCSSSAQHVVRLCACEESKPGGGGGGALAAVSGGGHSNSDKSARDKRLL